MDITAYNNLSLLAVLAALFPLLSFLIIALVPGRQGRGVVLSIVNISLSFLISGYLFTRIWNGEVVKAQIEWFAIGDFHMQIGVLVNKLSVLMLVLVTLIALLVHIYSIKYMEGDRFLHRYWAYLGLFCFSMLGLVIADNLLLLYMFWELVGFSSYLLIGFWFTRETAAAASKKAFIMNRLGDLGFLTGIMIVYSAFGTFDLSVLFGDSGLLSHGIITKPSLTLSDGWLTAAGIAFFFGACAKSAQFPLHTWLPDAMEGPTAVSSLIHAATMVAAGVFLLARIHPLFNPSVLIVIALVGAFTAFMSATIALTQNDIKRILAFSTISQLGFMMIAMGIGANAAGLFHLVTHAFFKCLLFLAAGAVIHEMVHLKSKTSMDFDAQDIRNMGGLRKEMPVTFVTMLLASLALAGIPLSSGFLSKDAILIQAFAWADFQSGWLRIVPCAALLTSWLTVFYVSRLIFKVFFGEFRLNNDRELRSHIHEAPGAMKYVLIALSVFCLFPAFALHPFHYDHAWIYEAFNMELAEKEDYLALNTYKRLIPLLVVAVSGLLIFLAYRKYSRTTESRSSSNRLINLSKNQWYFDEMYQATFVNGIMKLSALVFSFDRIVVDGIVNLMASIGIFLSSVSAVFDKYIIDGVVNGTASVAKTIGNFARHFQTGRLQHYMLTMVLAVLIFFIIQYLSQAI